MLRKFIDDGLEYVLTLVSEGIVLSDTICGSSDLIADSALFCCLRLTKLDLELLLSRTVLITLSTMSLQLSLSFASTRPVQTSLLTALTSDAFLSPLLANKDCKVVARAWNLARGFVGRARGGTSESGRGESAEIEEPASSLPRECGCGGWAWGWLGAARS